MKKSPSCSHRQVASVFAQLILPFGVLNKDKCRKKKETCCLSCLNIQKAIYSVLLYYSECNKSGKFLLSGRRL